MPKVTQEHIDDRKEEIIQACLYLYQKYGYREITLKKISEETSFSRPTIYNYFKTKEEIFLGVLIQEYQRLSQDIEYVRDHFEKLSKKEFSQEIAKCFALRETLLKISAMNLYEIEEHSSIECLQSFKLSFRKTIDIMNDCMDKFFYNESKEKKILIQYGFFPFTYGVYPYTMPTIKQKKAMDYIGFTYKPMSIYEITYRLLNQLLK